MSNAVKSQGTYLEIGTGTGGAKTITAVTAGYPTLLTATAHGFTDGGVVTLAALTGTDAALLNSKTLVVLFKTANTFAVDVDTTGKTVTAGSGTATPVTWTEVGECSNFSGFDGESSEVDTTHLRSTAKESMTGLEDFGGFTADCNYIGGDAGQAAIRAAKTASTTKNFRLTLADTSTATFSANVKQFSFSAGVDAVNKGSISLKITGAVTWA